MQSGMPPSFCPRFQSKGARAHGTNQPERPLAHAACTNLNAQPSARPVRYRRRHASSTGMHLNGKQGTRTETQRAATVRGGSLRWLAYDRRRSGEDTMGGAAEGTCARRQRARRCPRPRRRPRPPGRARRRRGPRGGRGSRAPARGTARRTARPRRTSRTARSPRADAEAAARSGRRDGR